MKILHVITSLHTGGAEKLMVDLLPRLRDLGNDVDLLLFDGTRTPFYEELEKYGIKIHYLSIGGNVYNPLYIFRLVKIIIRYDIVHTHNTACQYFIPLAKILSRAKCKLVTTEHSTNNRRRNSKTFRYLDKFIYNKYLSIISISKDASDALKNFIGENFNITTIENGINLSKFQTLRQSVFTIDEKIVTMVAGFREAKDQDTLLKAIKILPEEYTLWLVGDGERRTILENLVSELGISNRVKFWGMRSDIPQILEQSHIIVLSSHWEGLSLSCIEGMASGRPFIASDVDGLRDVVCGHGILFSHEDYNALATEIESLCNNQDKYNNIVSSCQAKALQYDISVMAQKYNQVYYEIL